MKIPYRLRRTADVHATQALLLPGHDVAVVLGLCAPLALDAPLIFAVTDGFLLRLSHPIDKPVAGAIRLGELGANLLLPVDGELVPALLADEADALGRRRGLIFLPEGRVVAPISMLKNAAVLPNLSLSPLRKTGSAARPVSSNDPDTYTHLTGTSDPFGSREEVTSYRLAAANRLRRRRI